jgi:hypothetical protein
MSAGIIVLIVFGALSVIATLAVLACLNMSGRISQQEEREAAREKALGARSPVGSIIPPARRERLRRDWDEAAAVEAVDEPARGSV